MVIFTNFIKNSCLFLRVCLTDERKRNLDLVIPESSSCTGSDPWWAILNVRVESIKGLESSSRGGSKGARSLLPERSAGKGTLRRPSSLS